MDKAQKKRSDLKLLYDMLAIRRFEEKAQQQYQMQKIGGFLHLYIGQEAVAVGSVAGCRHEDYLITAYRDHGHALARGMGMNECMAEIFGKATGCSKGLGGSMHYFDKENNMMGGHAIVGDYDLRFRRGNWRGSHPFCRRKLRRVDPHRPRRPR